MMLLVSGGGQWSRSWLVAAAPVAVGVGLVVAAFMSVAPGLSIAASGDLASWRDRAATLAYRKAELVYEQAVVAAAPASQAAVEGLAGRLGGECSGVVAGVRQRMRRTRSGLVRLPRREGEEARMHRQWSDLTYELTRVIGLTRDGPYRQAALAFAHQVLMLRWSDRAVTAFEHANARAVEWEVDGALPAVCADIQAWVGSGYRRLPAATAVLEREHKAVQRPFDRFFVRAPSGLFTNPVSRYEGSAARAFVLRLAGVVQQRRGAFERTVTVAQQIRIALGVSSEVEIEELTKFSKRQKLVPKGAIVIGKGKTAAGSTYTMWVEPRRRGRSRGGALIEASATRRTCEQVDVVEVTRPAAEESLSISGEPRVACLSRLHPLALRLRCQQENLTIEAQTVAGARRVRLTLADGRQILSRVAVVPRRLGGAYGFYYQAVQVWSSAPVAITELDSRGRPVRTLSLRRATPRCPSQWPFVWPGSVRSIASGQVPGGPLFSIIASNGLPGETPPRRSEISVEIEVNGEPDFGGIERDAGGRFAWQIDSGCQPSEYAILYGVLSSKRDTVWARGPNGLTRLRRVRIPASLHSHSVLAYAAFTAVPSLLVVRGPSGKTLSTQKLTTIAREARETCEGEAEPPA
jgi:hypothetical protein